jgi:hypothetical protein
VCEAKRRQKRCIITGRVLGVRARKESPGGMIQRLLPKEAFILSLVELEQAQQLALLHLAQGQGQRDPRQTRQPVTGRLPDLQFLIRKRACISLNIILVHQSQHCFSLP